MYSELIMVYFYFDRQAMNQIELEKKKKKEKRQKSDAQFKEQKVEIFVCENERKFHNR